jgi:hypothetical protein
MAIRKNAKFLTAAEQEAFVKACVLMKADIVNTGAPAAQQYSRWDENVAIHQEIQAGVAPGPISVNFGHGGNGAYSFLSWHRYFLYQVEKQLQSYVPGVMIPYWDWTDPAPIMTDTFLGPNGTVERILRRRRAWYGDQPHPGAAVVAGRPDRLATPRRVRRRVRPPPPGAQPGCGLADRR